MRFVRTVFAVILLAAALTLTALAEEYAVDLSHSKVLFRVRHLGISSVTGQFDQFEASFNFDPERPEKSKVTARIQADSVDTAVEDRDNHLRSADFLDVAKYPEILFVTTRVEPVAEGRFKAHGNLTIHGTTRPVVLDVELGGVITDPWGNRRAAFEATTTINRKDFGLTWNRVMETGALVVGEEVRITLEIEAVASQEG